MKRLTIMVLVLAMLVSACGALAPTATPVPNKVAAPTVATVPTKAPVSQVLSWAGESQLTGAVPCCSAVLDKNTTAMQQLVFESLVVMNRQTSKMEPLLAKSWTVSPDGLTWTFNLRENVRFSDGSPLLASTVKYWYDKALEPTSKTPPRLSNLKGIVAEDPLVLKVTTSQPNSLVIYGMGLMIQGLNSISEKPVGTGPYAYTTISNEKVTVVRRADYWGKVPTLEGITYYARPDATSRLAGLKTGEVDLIQNLTVENVAGLTADPKFAVLHPDSSVMMAIRYNTRQPQWSDAKVRLALNHALQRQPIVENILLGAGYLPHSLGGDGVYGTPPSNTELYPYDPSKAESLMKEAGWVKNSAGKWEKDGKLLTMLLSYSEGRYLKAADVAEYVIAQLTKFGVTVNPQAKPWAEWSPNVMGWSRDKLIDAAISGQGGTYAMGGWANDGRCPKPEANHYTGWCNKDYDAIMASFEATMDEPTQLQMLAKAHALMASQAPYLLLVGQQPYWAATKKVTGLTFNRNEIPLFDGVVMQ